MAAEDDALLTILGRRRGRAVAVQPDGTLYVSHHYCIHRSDSDGGNWVRVAAMPRSLVRRAAECSRLACRLLRHELRTLAVLSDGTIVVSSRMGGIGWARPGETPVMCASRVDEGSAPWQPPISICVGPDDRVLWGEYFGNPRRREVRLYVSDDRGRSFHVAYVFPAGTIRHVHGIMYDEHLHQYWVLTGDHGDEPGIARLSTDLRNLDWVARGEQQYRAVRVFDFGDRLVYGTDTELEPNAIVSLDKSTGRAERVMELDGSCIHACRFGELCALTTTVEPSRVNTVRDAVLWLSRDGERWQRAFQAPKDRWSEKYFQYGSLVLPDGASGREVILFSGQAVKGIDGQAIVARMTG